MFVLKDVNTVMEYVSGFDPAGQVILDSDIQNAQRWDSIPELLRDLRELPALPTVNQNPLKILRVRGNRFAEDGDVS